nr:hypothetical protein [Tanacetum cinerariifolium]
FVDPKFRNKVYKVVKDLYGLHQAPRAWYAILSTFLEKSGYRRGTIDNTLFIKQDKKDIMLVEVYVDDIIFDSTKKSCVKTASTPIETQNPLVKDEEAVDVDVHLYRYLKGQPKLGLWYPKVSSFDLEVYSDSDYTGANLNRKSTIGGCQFLGRRLILWQCKKQTIVATSTTKAEYVVPTHCCGQVLWIQNELLDYGFNLMNTKIYIDNEITICIVKNHVFHSKTKHIEIQHHVIRDAYEKKLTQVLEIHTNDNVADLLTKAFDVSGFNFLATVSIKKANDVVKLRALIDGKRVVITEDVIRQALHLDDVDVQRGQHGTNLVVQWRLLSSALLQEEDDDNVVTKDASAAEPTVFDDEEVTMTMAQTLIKMKAEKARLFDEQMANRLHDEEVKQAAAREK